MKTRAGAAMSPIKPQVWHAPLDKSASVNDLASPTLVLSSRNGRALSVANSGSASARSGQRIGTGNGNGQESEHRLRRTASASAGSRGGRGGAFDGFGGASVSNPASRSVSRASHGSYVSGGATSSLDLSYPIQGVPMLDVSPQARLIVAQHATPSGGNRRLERPLARGNQPAGRSSKRAKNQRKQGPPSLRSPPRLWPEDQLRLMQTHSDKQRGLHAQQRSLQSATGAPGPASDASAEGAASDVGEWGSTVRPKSAASGSGAGGGGGTRSGGGGGAAGGTGRDWLGSSELTPRSEGVAWDQAFAEPNVLAVTSSLAHRPAAGVSVLAQDSARLRARPMAATS